MEAFFYPEQSEEIISMIEIFLLASAFLLPSFLMTFPQPFRYIHSNP